MSKKLYLLALLSTLGLLGGCGGSSTSNTSNANPTQPTVTPALYTETNATTGNSVLAYSRGSDGTLTTIGSVPTGANGAGLPTYSGALPFPVGGATGAVRLSPDGTRLYAVDAGSADVAAFNVAADGSLTLIGRYPTGGTSPASITIDSTGTYLYVLNTGSVSSGVNTPGGITGFTIGTDGSLTPLSGSTQPLSANAYVDPSEVAFSPDGTYLAATEKATSLIDIYPVTAGVAGAPVSVASSGSIPFGFAFTPTGTMVVSNVESLTDVTASTVSSYSATSAGVVTPISNRVPDDQGGSCWVALTTDGAYAYVVNTLTGAISGYSIGTTGTLTLLTAGGATASQANTTGPIDDVVTPDNAYLYVIDSNAGASPGTIAGFSIAANRSLTSVSTGVTGLLPGSLGLAVR